MPPGLPGNRPADLLGHAPQRSLAPGLPTGTGCPIMRDVCGLRRCDRSSSLRSLQNHRHQSQSSFKER
jgi:hypothetical protein